MLEIWLTLGFLALVTSLLSPGGKRLGDIFAGTFVITERLPGQRGTTAPMSALPPALAAWAATAELSGLTDATAEMARQYLSRYYEFTPATRDEFGQRIAAAVAAQVSPPPPAGSSPPTTCPRCSPSAAQRAHARMAGQTSPGSPGGPRAAAPAAPAARAHPPGTPPPHPAAGDPPVPPTTGDAPVPPASPAPPAADAPPLRPGGFLPPR